MTNIPKNIKDLIGLPLEQLTAYLSGTDYRLRADAACVIGDMVRDMSEKSLPEETVEALHILLKDIEPSVRLEAAIALSLIGDGEATPVLRELAERRAFRLDAIYVLGKIGDRESIPMLNNMLIRFLASWSEKVQAAAALTLMGEKTGQDYLVGCLKSWRRLERAAACHFIGESHHPEALSILKEIAVDEKNRLRGTALRSMGFLDEPEAEAFLCEHYDNLPLIFQNDVITALEEIAKKRQLSEKAKKILTNYGN